MDDNLIDNFDIKVPKGKPIFENVNIV